MTRFICCALLFVSCAGFAEESLNGALERLHTSIMAYLINVSNEADELKWARQWKSRLEQAAYDDSNFSEEKFTLRVVQEFCEDNVRQLEDPSVIKKERLIYACRLLRQCHDKQYTLPNRVREHLTVNGINNAIEFLNKKVEDKR